jgi:hypothetical protein
MDSITMIRVIAGLVAVVLLAVIVTRRKRMSSANRATSKR